MCSSHFLSFTILSRSTRYLAKKGLRQGIVVVAKVIARLDVDKWHKADPAKGVAIFAPTRRCEGQREILL